MGCICLWTTCSQAEVPANSLAGMEVNYFPVVPFPGLMHWG